MPNRRTSIMWPSPRLLRHACQITLFTRANCGLCTQAKQVLSNVWDKRPFEYQEIDVMAAGQQAWKDLYEFDTPVVSLSLFSLAIRLEAYKKKVHIEKSANQDGPLSRGSRKLMHRFIETDIEKLMNEAEQS
ncbi:MAG: hypothetical protein M1822_004055 [Bathelium mastoideum]|nr:MAG: hypothetical protein M1822_004055 [Bathelium mastoideum]